MAALTVRRRRALAIVLTGIGALLFLVSTWLFLTRFPVHRWLSVAAFALTDLLALVWALQRRWPGLRAGVWALSAALGITLVGGGGVAARDVLRDLAARLDAPPATTGCGLFGLAGHHWDDRAKEVARRAFPGYQVAVVRRCRRFVTGGEREVRLRIGRFLDPHLSTELVVEERITFRDDLGGPVLTGLAPYPSAHAVSADLARVDATPGLAKHLGAGKKLCLFSDAGLFHAWVIRCIALAGLATQPAALPGWPQPRIFGRCPGADPAHAPCFSGPVGLPR